MVNLCDTDFQRLRDVPCDCAPPPFQCEVDEFAELPMSAPCPPNPNHTGSTEPLKNGDVYVVINDPSGQPTPYMFWDCNWYALAIDPGDQDTDWFKEGTVGPGYGGINTDNAYHNGKIAINRTSVRGFAGVFDMEGQILSDGTFVGSGSGDVLTPVLGLGTRMMWIPELAAFRAGSIGADQWDFNPPGTINVGEYSGAFGLNNEVAGDFGFASGANNTILSTAQAGVDSRFGTAFGSSNVVKADSGFAIGQGNEASGDDAFVAGEDNVSSGRNSVVFGASSDATGDQGFTHGINSTINAAFKGVVFGDNVRLNILAEKTTLFGIEEVAAFAEFVQDRSFIVHNLIPFLHTPPDTSGPPNSELAKSMLTFWVNEATDDLTFKVKYSDGVTVKTGTVALV